MISANQLWPTPGPENAGNRILLRRSAANLPWNLGRGASNRPGTFQEYEITEPCRLCGRSTLPDVALLLPWGSDTDGRRSSTLLSSGVLA